MESLEVVVIVVFIVPWVELVEDSLVLSDVLNSDHRPRGTSVESLEVVVIVVFIVPLVELVEVSLVLSDVLNSDHRMQAFPDLVFELFPLEFSMEQSSLLLTQSSKQDFSTGAEFWVETKQLGPAMFSVLLPMKSSEMSIQTELSKDFRNSNFPVKFPFV